MPRVNASLRERILAADDSLLVCEIIAPERMAALGDVLSAAFAAMRVEWLDSRVWGQSFTMGDEVVYLGHRRGDHVATHPHLHGLDNETAGELLRLQLEGTLLHELGHAILDASPVRARVLTACGVLLRTEGAVSSYLGMTAKRGSAADVRHEAFAEAVRYWCHHDKKLRTRYPGWHTLVDAEFDRYHR